MESLENGCPYLGLVNDAGARGMTPDDNHRCYRLSSSRRVSLKQQAEICLSANPENCAIFTEVEAENKPQPLGFVTWLAAIVLLMAVAVGVVVFGIPFDFYPQMEANAANENITRSVWSTPGVTQTSELTAAPAIIVQPTVLSTMVPTAVASTVVPAVTPTVPPLPTAAPTAARVAPTATKAPAVQPTKVLATAMPGTTAPVANPTPFVHVVVKGDTLGNIAYKYKTTVAAIAQANGLKDVTKLEVGQRLVIPR
jgi:LysM repeat protein